MMIKRKEEVEEEDETDVEDRRSQKCEIRSSANFE